MLMTLMRVFPAQLRRQDLHVTRQHNNVGFMVFDQTRDFGERRLFVFGINRHMVIRDAVPFDHAAQVLVVGNHAGDFAVQFIAVPAVQQVCQAVGFPTGHQHDAFFLRGVGNAPVHRKLFGDGRKGFTETFEVERQGIGAHFMTHEKPAAEVVRVMARFGNPAVVRRQKVTDLGNDTDTVRASNHQTKSAHVKNSRTSQRPPF